MRKLMWILPLLLLVIPVGAAAQVSGCPTGQHGICISWTPSTTNSVTTTTLVRGLTPGGEVLGTYVCTMPQATASCLDQTGVPGITYYYKAAAWDAPGPPNGLESPLSNEASAVYPTAPSSPTGTTATPQ